FHGVTDLDGASPSARCALPVSHDPFSPWSLLVGGEDLSPEQLTLDLPVAPSACSPGPAARSALNARRPDPDVRAWGGGRTGATCAGRDRDASATGSEG